MLREQQCVLGRDLGALSLGDMGLGGHGRAPRCLVSCSYLSKLMSFPHSLLFLVNLSSSKMYLFSLS